MVAITRQNDCMLGHVQVDFTEHSKSMVVRYFAVFTDFRDFSCLRVSHLLLGQGLTDVLAAVRPHDSSTSSQSRVLTKKPPRIQRKYRKARRTYGTEEVVLFDRCVSRYISCYPVVYGRMDLASIAVAPAAAVAVFIVVFLVFVVVAIKTCGITTLHVSEQLTRILA